MVESASSQDYIIEYIRTQLELLENEEEGMTYWLAEMYECIEEWRLEEGQRLVQAIKSLDLSAHALGLFYLGVGDLYHQRQAWPEAANAYQRALTNFRNLDKKDDIALVLNQLALTLQEQQDYENAIAYYKEAVSIYEALGNIRELGRAFVNLGSVADAQTDWRQAISYYQKAVQYFEQVESNSDLASALNNLGVAFECWGNFTEAENHYMRCVDLLDELGETYSTKGIRILANLGQLYAKQGEWDKTENCYRWALEICQEIEDLYGESTTWNNLGTVYNAKKDYNKAGECYQRSIQLHHQLGDKQGEALALSNLGTAYADLGESKLAETCYRNSLLVSQDLGDPQGIARSHNNLGVLYETLKQFDKAIDHYRKCVAIVRELDDGYEEVTTLINTCTLYASELMQTEEIEPYFERAWKIAEDRQYTEHLVSLCMLKGDLAFQYSRFQEAYRWCADGCRYALQLNTTILDRVFDHLLLHIERLQRQNKYEELREFCTILLEILSDEAVSGERHQFFETLRELVATSNE